MSDPSVTSGDWSGVAGFVTALGALIATFVRRGPKKEELHSVRNKAHDAVLRVAVVETRLGDIDRRLTRIEEGQEKIADKLDRALAPR